MLGDTAFGKLITEKLQRIFFYPELDDEEIDLYHFTQLIPASIPAKPYVVDFTYVSALADLSRISPSVVDRVFCFLSNSCRIIPLSKAAHRSLKHLFSAKRYNKIRDKIEVVYPALPNYHALLNSQSDYPQNSTGALRLLFVGNHAYRKGLPELLRAFARLANKYNDLNLYVISKASKHLACEHNSDRIKWFSPSFSHIEIARQFYLPCDLFVLPTHEDIFGMAILHSLSCGTPVLATEQFAVREIIKDGHNGFFVRSDRLYLEETPFPCRESRKKFYGSKIGKESILVNDLVDKIEYLYHNRYLLEEMSRRAVKDFELGGKFSIDVRNRKLEEIYRSCLCD
jgi:glycosyltransferase involved in cell wall biosynthesis